MNTALAMVAVIVPAIVSFLVTRMSLANQHDLLKQSLAHQRELHQNDLDNERRRSEDAVLEEWSERGRETAADLLLLLAGGFQQGWVHLDEGVLAVEKYESDVRRRIVLLWKFAPDDASVVQTLPHRTSSRHLVALLRPNCVH